MRRLTSLLAALLLGSAAGLVVATAPATAAACPAGSGVTVVVGSSVSCDTNGGGPASNNFRDAGHTLTPVDRQPGFVCQVDGAPSSANCVNTPPSDAYWGLFSSDGSGDWVYASQGVGTLRVPAGGWVAFVFQTGGGRTYPSVSPVSAKPAVKPTAQPTKKPAPAPTKKPSAKPSAATPAPVTTKGAASATPTPTAGAAPTATPTPTQGATTPAPATSGPTPIEPSGTAAPANPESTDDTTPTAGSDDSSSSDGSGPLGWVAGALVVALLGGMGAVTWRRRASGGVS